MSLVWYCIVLLVMSASMSIALWGMRGDIGHGLFRGAVATLLACLIVFESWNYTNPEQALVMDALFAFEMILVVRAGYVRFVLPLES